MRSLSPTVPERLRISRDELSRWAGTPMAHSEMPRLIQALERGIAGMYATHRLHMVDAVG